MFYMTGFADEVSPDVDVQIKVTKELGWKNIEARGLFAYNKNIASISDEEFDILCGKLKDAGISINCYGSAIANWQHPITEEAESSYAELAKAIPRLQKLGTKMVRIMSFRLDPALKPQSWEYEAEVIKRVTHIVKMAEDAGLLLVHENCNNWGGLSYEHTLRLIEQVKSPALRLVFDTGNPVFNDDVRSGSPYHKQSSWEFYKHVREFIAYVHIKDGRMDGDKMVFTYAGEGEGDVPQIFADLVKTGYKGGFSIEPHMGAIFHDDSFKTSDQYRYENYVEYGRRCESMLKKLYGF